MNDSIPPEDVPAAATSEATHGTPAPQTPDLMAQPALAGPSEASEAVTLDSAGDESVVDDFPEYEPLTPEILEDEAIRGDKVIGWAVLGLTLLLGMSPISSSRTLVHIKSGEWLLANGLVPSTVDPFAISTESIRWVNVGWLFDIAVACVYRLGGIERGWVFLSVVQGLLAASIAVCLLQARLPQVRTWWVAVCTAAALVAAIPVLTLETPLVTLVGLAASMWLFIRWEQTKCYDWLWVWTGLLVVWANLDAKSSLGLVLLMVGTSRAWPTWLSNGKPGLYSLGALAAAALGVTFLHPFPIDSLTGVRDAFQFDLPAARALFGQTTLTGQLARPLNANFLLSQPSLAVCAGLGLSLVAIVTMLLDFKRTPWAHWVISLGFTALAVMTAGFLPAAAIVNAALAAYHGQMWYWTTSTQEYSLDLSAIVMSRGGRALTVIGLLALALMTVTGRIDGPDGKRTGVGLTPELGSLVTACQDLSGHGIPSRIFNLNPRHGDALIWAGFSPAIDCRFELHGRATPWQLSASEEIFVPNVARHDNVRRSLRRKTAEDELSGRAEIWTNAFQTMQTGLVMPRLFPTASSPPDYALFGDLVSSPSWELGHLNPAGALFIQRGSTIPEVVEFLKSTPFKPLDDAFRPAANSVNVPTQPRDWPTPPLAYQQLLSVPRSPVSNAVQLANHHVHVASLAQGPDFLVRLAMATSGLRSALVGVAEQPQSAPAYASLGRAYRLLAALEQQPGGSSGLAGNSLRFAETSCAFRSAVLLNPAFVDVYLDLFSHYQAAGKNELALEAVDQYLERSPLRFDLSERELRQRERVLDSQQQLRSLVNDVRAKGNEELERGGNPIALSLRAAQLGCTNLAIEFIRRDAPALAAQPEAQLQLANWLLEAGRAQEAADVLDNIERVASRYSVPGWQIAGGISAQVSGDPGRAQSLWGDWTQLAYRQNLQSLLVTLPLTSLPPELVGSETFPLPHSYSSVASASAGQGGPHLTNLYSALVAIEWGQMQEATITLRRILAGTTDPGVRNLAALYLLCIEQKPVDPTLPADWIPVSPDMFATE